MTRLFYSILILLSYFISTSVHAQETLKIVASDEWGVELELQLAVPQVQLTELTGDDQQSYLRLQVADWFTTDKIGFPELPRIATLLQIPESGELHATILSQDVHSAFVPAIYPVPTVTQTSGQSSEQFIKNASAYATDQFYPEQLIEIEPREMLRDVPVARVKVHPFRWNSQTHELRYITQLRFRIDFSQALSPVVDVPATPFTPLLRRAINGYTPRQSQVRATPTLPARSLYPQRYSAQMTIKNAGMVRVRYQDLLAAGLPEACLQQGQFVIHSQGQQLIPQVLMKNSRIFNIGDSLEFYASELINAFVDNNLYQIDCWQFSANAAQPVATSTSPTRWGNFVNGGLSGAFPELTTFSETLHLEKDLELWEETPGTCQRFLVLETSQCACCA
ncbi:MAG: C25 family peptidase propeptide domain-containing protein [Thiotrichaceae bacterium]